MKNVLKKVGRGVLAGLTSPEAIKNEKSLVALVLTRVVTQLGGGASAIAILQHYIG